MERFFEANAQFSKFSRNYMELKKDHPIRPSEMGVLNIITGTPGPHTPVMLAEMIGVSKPMITAHLTVLTQKGYVIRQQSQEDKRVVYVMPTEKAWELVAEIGEERDQLMDHLVQELGDDGFDTLLQLISKANAVLRAERKPAERS